MYKYLRVNVLEGLRMLYGYVDLEYGGRSVPYQYRTNVWHRRIRVPSGFLFWRCHSFSLHNSFGQFKRSTRPPRPIFTSCCFSATLQLVGSTHSSLAFELRKEAHMVQMTWASENCSMW